MYVSGWMSLVIVSLWVSLVGFVWAYRSGQFSDQERARYLPLDEDVPAYKTQAPTRLPAGIYALLIVGIIGFLILLAPLALHIYRLKGTG